MPPLTSRDFQKAARQRFEAAETLLSEKLTLDAQYIAGYTIECSLKALILQMTPEATKPAMLKRITSGEKMHDPEVLKSLLSDLGAHLPPRLTERLRQTIKRSKWSTSLRYETGRRDTSETRAFLKTAQAIYVWVEGQLT